MNPTHRAIRAKLQSMAPQRAVKFIAGLELPGDEAFCIIECDVRGEVPPAGGRPAFRVAGIREEVQAQRLPQDRGRRQGQVKERPNGDLFQALCWVFFVL